MMCLRRGTDRFTGRVPWVTPTMSHASRVGDLAKEMAELAAQVARRAEGVIEEDPKTR